MVPLEQPKSCHHNFQSPNDLRARTRLDSVSDWHKCGEKPFLRTAGRRLRRMRAPVDAALPNAAVQLKIAYGEVLRALGFCRAALYDVRCKG